MPVDDESTKGTSTTFGKLKYGLLFLLLVPGFAFNAMKERKAAEAAAAAAVGDADPAVPGLKVKLSKAADTFTYQDGTELPYEGFGYAVLTWDDVQKNPDKLKKAGFEPKEADFPVVAFFNASGFDPDGDPVVVRRAKDGSLLFELKDRPKKQLASMSPQRDGTFKIVFRDGTTEVVKEADWYRTYMGVEPPQAIPAPEQLDKMSDDDLKKLGVTRMTREEYEKKHGPVASAPAPSAGPTGINGVVIRVGGVAAAVQPLSGVKVYALKGAADPGPLADTDPRIVARGVTDKDGAYSFPLPDGVYTIVAVVEGVARGNALNAAKWPSVKVAGGWVDYPFRVPPIGN